MRRRLEPTVRSIRDSKTFLPNGPAASPRRQPGAFQGSSAGPALLAITIMDLVAGVDSSTQSTKVLLCRADDGTVVGSASAPHPDGTECHPDHWWEALTSAGRGLLERADAIGVGAQQHGMVDARLRGRGRQGRDALERREVRAAGGALVAEFGGRGRVGGADRVGADDVVHRHQAALAGRERAANAARVHRVVLPHDWLTWRLAGGPGARQRRVGRRPTGGRVGTGYFSPAERPGCRTTPSGRSGGRSRCRGWPGRPRSSGGPRGARRCRPGTGDNMAAALGLGLAEGTWRSPSAPRVTAYAVPRKDPPTRAGWSAGFADATGRFLPLACTSTRPGCST